MVVSGLTFPLVPRWRLAGLAFGGIRSLRRGVGFDVAGSRPYRPGDTVRTIDWGATARLSSARAKDEFIIRERYAEEAPRVVIVCDRRPEMSLFPPDFPWLSKPNVMATAGAMIAESALRERGLVGYLDYADAAHADSTKRQGPFWRPPTSQRGFSRVEESDLEYPSFFAPPDNLTRALSFLTEHPRYLPQGSFVFVLSDFLVSPSAEAWSVARQRRWDVVPVVIQDPVWEQSFPPVGSVVVPLADPSSGRLRLVRLTRKQASRRRAANEERRDRIIGEFHSLDLDPVLLSSSEPNSIFRAFLSWSDERLQARRRGRHR